MYSKQSICFVIPNFVTFSTGGAEIQVHYLTQMFLKKGWKVEVVCAGNGKEEMIKTSPYLNSQIVYNYYKKSNIRSLEFFSVLKALQKTNAKYYYQRTDFALTAATKWFCSRKKRKMIYALASDSDAKKGKYKTMFREFSYQSVFKKMIRKSDFYVLDRIVEWAKRKTDYTLCQNQQQADDYKVSFGRECYIVPNSFLPSDQPIMDKENIVLWVGNNNPVKRPELFVDLATMCKDTDECRFVMIGSACELLDGLKMPPNLQLLGPQNYDETNKWLSKALVFVNTSSYEGVPNTFIQSWFYKTLILSLSVNPDGVLSNSNKAGVCFDGDLHQLSKYIKQVVKCEVNTQEMIKSGTAYFNATFSADENVDKLISLISE